MIARPFIWDLCNHLEEKSLMKLSLETWKEYFMSDVPPECKEDPVLNNLAEEFAYHLLILTGDKEPEWNSGKTHEDGNILD